ncbi:DNA adenine methylase [Flavivirga abyssicola]|uniref:DNA adenine methylase n=1 Tax=Flavivirga abyssicola TaxID=3063533 RepID=UPI0026DF54E3|nr:DNA adenine methylase [Flavivirga sp. MEBiC07777]WVK15087.1 DNA adenine methylase [Flavivirga sp. MEBiC07777]
MPLIQKKTDIGLKTPITYYGGKQKMLKEILPLIPEHEIYVEPFFGGGAVYWAKPPSKIEIINDVDANVINFYEVLKHDFFKLREKIEGTLHSRLMYKCAKVIYECPFLFDRVTRAWAFWVVTNQGFASTIGSWGFSKKNSAITVSNKVEAFKETLANRLKHTQIENNKAHKVILSRDSEKTFIYADPPYIDTDQGHYGGYDSERYRRDLDALASIKGKFLLSSYPSDILNEYIKKYNWYTISIDKTLNTNKSNGKRKMKKEVLTANYPIW